MFRSLFLILIACSVPLLSAQNSSNAPLPDPTALLRDKDQALLDAIAPGDSKIWDAALSPDAIYVDENGQIIPRAEFLKQLTPLGPGASGSIKIKSYSATAHGDVATVIHTDDEQESFHGQQLHAEYLTTETWQKIGSDWKLQMVHTYAVLHDPPRIPLAAAELDLYAGKYSAGDLVYSIRRNGDDLVGERSGRTPTILQCEVRDVFFIAGQPRTRKIFQRDSAGKITGFVDRREGVDLTWTRVP